MVFDPNMFAQMGMMSGMGMGDMGLMGMMAPEMAGAGASAAAGTDLFASLYNPTSLDAMAANNAAMGVPPDFGMLSGRFSGMGPGMPGMNPMDPATGFAGLLNPASVNPAVATLAPPAQVTPAVGSTQAPAPVEERVVPPRTGMDQLKDRMIGAKNTAGLTPEQMKTLQMMMPKSQQDQQKQMSAPGAVNPGRGNFAGGMTGVQLPPTAKMQPRQGFAGLLGRR